MDRVFYRLLDILIFLPLLLRFAIWGVATYLDSNYIRRKRKPATRKILIFTFSSSYGSFKARGFLPNISLGEDRGYLNRQYIINPFCPASQIVNATDITTFIEWGTERFSRWKNLGLKYSRGAMILWDFFHYCVKLIKDEEINIILSNNPFKSAAIAFICSRLTRTPFCVHIRTAFDLQPRISPAAYPRIFGSQRLSKLVQKFILPRAEMVIPLSEARGKYAIQHGAKPEKIRVIPRVIDVSAFPRPDPNLSKELGIEGKKVISFAGRLVQFNYVSDIIHIAAKVCHQRKNAIFLMVGDGVERKSLEELTCNLGLENRVRFLGMHTWQKAAQIRLLSDVSLCLQAGNSLVEAAVAATPLIAYDVDWHYELVRNGETGFLLPEGDIDGVAEAIIKLLDEPELAKRMGQNARKLAVEKHSVEKVRQIKINVYEELIQRTR